MDSTNDGLTAAQACRLHHAITFTSEAMLLCGVPNMLMRDVLSAVDREMRVLFAKGEQTPNCPTEMLWKHRDVRYYEYKNGDKLIAETDTLPFLHQG